MSPVAVVTDSTACLPPDLLAVSQVRVVPIEVIIDGRTLHDGVDIESGAVAEAMVSDKQVTTSRPTPQAFLDAYEAAARSGAQSVVSIHLSAALSGTVDSARLAARDASIPVAVVDSRTIGMGLGFAALNAGRTALTGATQEEVVARAETTAAASNVVFYVDTLEFLRKGGRIGKASAWLGSALRVKPLLHMADGQVAPLEKARTPAKALARLIDVATEEAEAGNCQVAVQHLNTPDRAADVASRLGERLGTDVVVCDVGAVVAVHVGPGVISIAVAPT